MKLSSFIIGIGLTFLLSVFLLVVIPFAQLSALEMHVDPLEETLHPYPMYGLALAGEKVYQEQGCVYCHTQVIVPESFGSDIAKEWGPRKTVARDYIHRNGALIGSRRFGQDLSFAGWDGWEERGLTERGLYLMLFDPSIDRENPEATPENAILRKPSYRFLFDIREKEGIQPSPEALPIPSTSRYAPPEGYEVVPKREARELVAYILSLESNYSLPEAPLPEGEAEEGEGEETAATGEASAETGAAPAAEGDGEGDATSDSDAAAGATDA